MGYKVCIPVAGTGSRLGELTRYLNKSLVSIANRPTICHLIESFPSDAKFVIALGHKGDLVKDFLGLAYPDRDFEYARVELFEGEGSGLGLTLLACKELLQEPFIFISCDTLVEGYIPPPNENWMGYAETHDLDPYRTLEISKAQVINICEKGVGKSPTHKPYIGLAGILDYELFWSAMLSAGNQALQSGESFGMRDLLSKGVSAKLFRWHDMGNITSLNEAREFYREPGEPNILEKSNEAIWFVGEHVIKFSDDKKFINNRVKRVAELKGFVPEISGHRDNMYRYKKVDGNVFSEVVNLPLFEKLLQHSNIFWAHKELNECDHALFTEICRQFYQDKTYERVDLFYKNFSKSDKRESINGIEMPLLKNLLNDIDWNWISNGTPGRFHGDFHFENILWTQHEKIFTFLDWRQDFGGNLSVGDIYYDFAKLLHGLIISHELINRELYSVIWTDKSINFDFLRKQNLINCENYFFEWLYKNGFDVKKVKTLTALIYLNIAALHHNPYSLLLYSLGKQMLKTIMDEK